MNLKKEKKSSLLIKIRRNRIKLAFILGLTLLTGTMTYHGKAETASPHLQLFQTTNAAFTPPQLVSKVLEVGPVLTTPTPERVRSEKNLEGKVVLFPETHPTNQTLDEIKQLTKSEDSLIKPLVKKSNIAPKEDDKESEKAISTDVTVSAASIELLTGTPTFDSGTADTATGNLGNDPKAPSGNSSSAYTPGYDSNDTNDLVRSFDTITYLVSFSVQNKSMESQYKEIGYEVTATLDNAVTLNGSTPQVNGSIVNGTMYTNADGSQYSQGIVASSISGTGQVVVPVVVAVSSAPNGFKLQPTFTLKLTNGKMADGQEVDFDQIYVPNDGSDIGAGLIIPATTVSATPSIGIKLIHGSTQKGTDIFGGTNTLTDAHDLAAVTNLMPLSGRLSQDYRGTSYPTTAINYTLSSSGTYTTTAGTSNLASDQYVTPTLMAYAPATLNRTASFTYNSGSGYANKFTVALPAPHANTGQIYTTPPTSNQAAIGVYASGNFTASSSGAISNTNYIGVYNPYTYKMTGEITPDPLNHAFSSLELILSWDRTKVDGLAHSNKWTSYNLKLTVSTISYEGKTVSNPSANTLNYQTNVTEGEGSPHILLSLQE